MKKSSLDSMFSVCQGRCRASFEYSYNGLSPLPCSVACCFTECGLTTVRGLTSAFRKLYGGRPRVVVDYNLSGGSANGSTVSICPESLRMFLVSNSAAGYLEEDRAGHAAVVAVIAHELGHISSGGTHLPWPKRSRAQLSSYVQQRYKREIRRYGLEALWYRIRCAEEWEAWEDGRRIAEEAGLLDSAAHWEAWGAIRSRCLGSYKCMLQLQFLTDRRLREIIHLPQFDPEEAAYLAALL